MTMQSTNIFSGQIFPGIYVGDVIVSLIERSAHRLKGDILEALPKSRNNCLYYRTRRSNQENVNSSDSISFRKATPEETNWYKSTYKQGIFLNIEDMPKDQVINNYSIY